MGSFGYHGENKKEEEKPKGDGALDTVYGGGFNMETPAKNPFKESIAATPEKQYKLDYEFLTTPKPIL